MTGCKGTGILLCLLCLNPTFLLLNFLLCYYDLEGLCVLDCLLFTFNLFLHFNELFLLHSLADVFFPLSFLFFLLLLLSHFSQLLCNLFCFEFSVVMIFFSLSVSYAFALLCEPLIAPRVSPSLSLFFIRIIVEVVHQSLLSFLFFLC